MTAQQAHAGNLAQQSFPDIASGDAFETIALITGNICKQLITFQQAILTRQENNSLPTAQEISFQCKLINMLDKLRRLNAKGKANEAIEAFMKFAGAKNGSAAAPPPRANAGNKTGNVVETKSPEKTQPPPLTEQDFRDYRHLLGNFGKLTDNARIKFRGTHVNALWLEYNLAQYCQSPADRKFIHDAQQVIKSVERSDTLEIIRRHQAKPLSAAA